MSKANKKLTNKEIEGHLQQLYAAITEESRVLNVTMKVITDFVEFSNKSKEFEAFLSEKYKKKEEKPEVVPEVKK